MKNKFHGVFSLLLFTLAIVVALVGLWDRSSLLALLYLIIVGAAAYVILYAFCAKCVVRLNNCSHVFPGRLTRHLPPRKQLPYTFLDYTVTSLCLTVIVLFPQYWLMANMGTLLLFWALVIIAVVEILVFVCPQCKNEQCLMCPGRPSIEISKE